MPPEYDYYEPQERPRQQPEAGDPGANRNGLTEQSFEDVFDPRKRVQFDFNLIRGDRGSENPNKVETNEDGSVKRVSGNGMSREFNYENIDGRNEITSVIDKNGRSSEKWIRNRNVDGSLSDWFTCAKDGKVDARRGLKVDENGNYEFEDSDGKRDVSKACQRDANDLVIEDNKPGRTESRAEFLETMRNQLGPQRADRLEHMMDKYESRMADRAYIRKLAGHNPEAVDTEVDKTIEGTYRQLNEMVSENPPTQRFNQASRATLAENFMFHAAQPTTVDQGNNGTCWIESAYIAGGLINHSDHMARLLKEVSLTGSYTTLNNGDSDPQRLKFNFSNQLLTMGDEEKQWSIDNHSEQPWRSPVSLIFDRTLPVIGGRKEFKESNGGYSDEHTGLAKTMYMVTGDTVHDAGHLINNSERQTLMEKGAFINYTKVMTPRGWQGHMRTKQLVHEGDKWLVLQDDQHGEYKDRVLAEIHDPQKWTGYQRDMAYEPSFKARKVQRTNGH